ncbi:MAG: Pyruvate/ketoisovalerate oxidoreductase, gamma subunit [Candidatus Magasanikbacteria bacterium GW2011_GWC2_40_17]|uniref:Pyruvate/ketoisovalerate oxidoreductase, gamma subunit n=1 Tax=Candidatus Magasanikbacteria bacterium GW2011_GWA2_42_32 TaxID=1619039 RepID=A0A0G1CEX8_9BACT|nr:MAG: Pyruvate/ketoisovalerate oxidoreductase, gamma subunit [Candidatus Magasanikbacteria bacterium GW2011_GWC2_40_17]KKS57116.1 MAG: Pyruvate/ketoisovalerate oxidoreductase, gamma subunit [Candidatus Magasanikbacteria bacterium GW2011_GWA2_42_32]OGH85362.1 MAG: hypothetical protein A2294_01170 [Candidatus Magasanikbacteria bacterium RIFOXYB2_FULL_38_10]
MLLKILLAGDGGQGIQTIADIIVKASFNQDWQVSFIPNYGLEQRGGVSLGYIQISDKKIAYPKFSFADIMVVLSEQARERIQKYQNSQTQIGDYKNFDGLLKEKNLAEKSLNIFALGWLARRLQEKKILEIEEVGRLLKEKLGLKANWEENKKAFEVGVNYVL